MAARELTILQLNDLHGYLEPHAEAFRGAHGLRFADSGGLARIASVFRQVRRERPGAVLALDNGDTFHGTYVPVQTRGEAMLPLLNALGFAAMTAHWEFAYGPAQLRALAQRLAYPVLAMNVFEQDTGRAAFEPYRIVECAGLRVAILGIACNIVDKTMPASYSEGLRFTLGRSELPAHIEQVRGPERADLVVVLSHLGLPQDVKLAGEVDGIDVVISGHTHNRLREPVWVGRTPIIQSGCHGSFVGRLDLVVDGHAVVDVRHRLIGIDGTIAADAHMQSLVDEAMAPHRELLGEIVGRTPYALHRATSLEASMDNVLLDAIANVADTQLAFSNGWRYGAPIVPGPVTMQDLWNIVPTNPEVSTVELTGAEIGALLEANLERTYSADPYCQMGGYVKRCRGLAMYFKMENPRGSRIEDLLVEGAPVQPERTYRAAMLGVQGVPQKYGRHRAGTGVHAVDALRRLFSGGTPQGGEWRGSVTAI
jgi:S-sulfosulfanyl-L-cysteine sulfohydrolase